MSEMGSPGFKGYDYQINATVWVVLDLFLGQNRLSEVIVEPLSQEDLEAVIHDDTVDADAAESAIRASDDDGRLHIQIKRKSTGPWDLSGFIDVFVGDQTKKRDSRSRLRPYELLQQTPRARYLFITDAAVGESLVPYKTNTLLGRHSCTVLPASLKSRASISDELAQQFVILSMQLEELLLYRTTNLLSHQGLVPSLRADSCIEALRDQVRNRLLGKQDSGWTCDDVSATLKAFGGEPFINPRHAEYVEPASYAEVDTCLREHNAVLLIGPPGTGKTLTSEVIAARLASKSAVNIIRENSPERIRELLLQSGSFLFLLSDPWGGNKIDEKAPVNWTSELPKLLEFANPDKRFVITSRADVLRTAIGEVSFQRDQRQRKDHLLSSITVQIVPEDYSSDLRQQILRRKAVRLSPWQRDFLSRHERQIVERLHLPFSIERFVFHLGLTKSPTDTDIETLLDNAHVDTIVNTVRQQVQAWDASPIDCAAVAWALLTTSNPIANEQIEAVSTMLAVNGIVIEMHPFFDHLVSGGSIQPDASGLEAHPKVIEALEQVLATRPSAAGHALHRFLEVVSTRASSDPFLAKMLYRVARISQGENSPVHVQLPAQARESIFQIIAEKLVSERRALFLEGLREASTFKLPGVLGDVIQQLVPDKPNDKSRSFRHWESPELPHRFAEEVNANHAAIDTMKRFIEFSLPENEMMYPAGKFLEYLSTFAVDFSSSFMSAFETIVDRQQVCFNDDVIVAGALTSDSLFEYVHAKIIKLWESIDEWFEHFSPKLTAVRECEIDSEYSAHLEEEPGEHYGVVEGIAKAYVAVRRTRLGWQWLTDSNSKRFVEAWVSVVADTDTVPSPEEWNALLGICVDSDLRGYWSAVKNRGAKDRFTDVPQRTFASRYSATEFMEALVSIWQSDSPSMVGTIAKSLNSSSRVVLVIAIAGLSRFELNTEDGVSKSQLLDALTHAAESEEEAESLRILFELASETHFDDIRIGHKTPPTQKLRELATRLKVENEYASAVAAIASALFGAADTALLESLLESSDTETTRSAAFAAAVAEDASLLKRCLVHKHYRVRRTALQSLSANADDRLRRELMEMATDKSAPVRLEVAKTIGERHWSEGVPTLVRLLGDTRDYNEDSLTGGWTRFEVARQAARSLQRMPLNDETDKALIEFLSRGRKASADPIVRAEVILALSQSNNPVVLRLLFKMLNSSLSVGNEPTPRYVLRCAAAEAIVEYLASTPTTITSEQVSNILQASQAHDTALSIRAIVAAAAAYEWIWERYAHSVGLSERQAELFILAALSAGKPVTPESAAGLLGTTSPLLSMIESHAKVGTLPPKLPDDTQVWFDSLSVKDNNDRAVIYFFHKWCGIESDQPDGPWERDLEPKRIRTITLRSLTGDE